MASDKTQKEAANKLLATALSKAKAASQEGVLRASDLERGVKERLSAAQQERVHYQLQLVEQVFVQ